DRHAPVTRPDRWFLQYEIPTIPLDVIGASDSDPDGDRLRVVYATQPAHGHTAVVGGDLQYTGPLGAWGTALDVFTYVVTDGHGRYTAGRVTIDVRHPNAAP